MFNLFRICIFCGKDLPDPRSGVGEHVIPISIYGFWRLYDICGECIKYFGDNVDILATQNPYILESMQVLGISKVEKYYEQLPYLAEDTISKEKIKMVRRKGEYKSKVVKCSDDFLEFSEGDFEKIGIKFFIDKFRKSIPSEILNNELDSIREKYKSLKPGDSINSVLLGYTLRKRQIKDVKYNNNELKSITPLIAKTVFSAVHYFLPLDIIPNITNYSEIKNHARYNIPLRDYTINWCRFKNNEDRHLWHRIRFMNCGSKLILVDTTIFGFANWRTLLYFDKDARIVDIKNNPVETLSFYMDFTDLNNRRKFLTFSYRDNTYREVEFES